VNIDTLTLAMQCAHAMQQAMRGDRFLFENESMRIHQAILSSGRIGNEAHYWETTIASRYSESFCDFAFVHIIRKAKVKQSPDFARG
jgi:hypothetical protein